MSNEEDDGGDESVRGSVSYVMHDGNLEVYNPQKHDPHGVDVSAGEKAGGSGVEISNIKEDSDISVEITGIGIPIEKLRFYNPKDDDDKLRRDNLLCLNDNKGQKKIDKQTNKEGYVSTAKGEHKLRMAIGQKDGEKIFLDVKDIKAIHKAILEHNKNISGDEKERSFIYSFKQNNNEYANFIIDKNGISLKEKEMQKHFGQDFKKLNEILFNGRDAGVTISKGSDSGVKIDNGEEEPVKIWSEAQQKAVKGFLEAVGNRVSGDKEAKDEAELTSINKMINGLETGETTAKFQTGAFRNQNEDMVFELEYVAKVDNLAAKELTDVKNQLSAKLPNSKPKKIKVTIPKNQKNGDSKVRLNLPEGKEIVVDTKLDSLNLSIHNLNLSFTAEDFKLSLERYGGVARGPALSNLTPSSTPMSARGGLGSNKGLN